MLGIIGVKLLIEEWVHIGPVQNLLLVAAAFSIGIAASLIGDKRDPEGAQRRRAEQAEDAKDPDEAHQL